MADLNKTLALLRHLEYQLLLAVEGRPIRMADWVTPKEMHEALVMANRALEQKLGPQAVSQSARQRGAFAELHMLIQRRVNDGEDIATATEAVLGPLFGLPRSRTAPQERPALPGDSGTAGQSS